MPRNADQGRIIPQPWPKEHQTKGERKRGRDVHYDRCLGIDCPCYQEGLAASYDDRSEP